MLRSIFFGLSPAAIAVSVALHAAMFLAPADHGGASLSAGDETIGVEVLSEPAPPPEGAESESARMHVDRVTTRPKQAGFDSAPLTEDSRPRDPNTAHLPTRRTPPPNGILGPAVRGEATIGGLPRFAMTVGAVGDPQGSGSPSGTLASQGDDGAPMTEELVDSKAHLVRGKAPAYPVSARADGAEGDVDLELVVDTAGEVEYARVLRGLGHGLDESATRAARKFHFAPATKGGRPVRVRMEWSMQFRLQ